MDEITRKVLEFYRELPFNYRSTAETVADSIRKNNQILSAYPDLDTLLQRGQQQVLDVGCGAGWFTNTVAFYYNADVIGLDFNPVAVDRSRKVATCLEVNAQFAVADIFAYETPPHDIVCSIGVLHHTSDFDRAVRRVLRWVKPGGHLLLGLYHAYGRAPFLAHFREKRDGGVTEEALLEEFAGLVTLEDPCHLRSWFRDQVLHPHETSHTLASIHALVSPRGFKLLSTSVNRHQPIENLDALFALEPGLEAVGVKALEEKRYYPGFFTCLFERSMDQQ